MFTIKWKRANAPSKILPQWLPSVEPPSAPSSWGGRGLKIASEFRTARRPDPLALPWDTSLRIAWRTQLHPITGKTRVQS